jgi:SAM-dependent methyltransferase
MLLRASDGQEICLDSHRWHGEVDPDERAVLGALSGPVLDVGCGPGRVVVDFGRRGVPSLGVDPAPGAVRLARERGATVLQRSVFDRLPAEGRWGAVVLLDGNVGIGGDAVRLLARCRRLVALDGTILVEVDAPGSGWRTRRVRIEHAGEVGPWFDWVVVGADAIGLVAGVAGLRLERLEHAGGRWFAHLARAERVGGGKIGHPEHANGSHGSEHGDRRHAHVESSDHGGRRHALTERHCADH